MTFNELATCATCGEVLPFNENPDECESCGASLCLGCGNDKAYEGLCEECHELKENERMEEGSA